MKKNPRRLIPLLLACAFLLGGCTSPGKAEKQLTLDLKSAAYLLQFSSEITIAQYHMNLSKNSASLLSAQTVMGEQGFQEQVRSGKNALVKNAEILLGIQEQTLPNAIIYVTTLPSLGVTQEHLDSIFENYRTANVSFSTYFDRAEKNGISTNFNELQAILKKGTDALKTADETIQKLQTALSRFLTDYGKEPEDLGWKLAIKSSHSVIEQVQASDQLLAHCFDVIDLNRSVSDFYSRFSGLIFRHSQAAAFPPSEVSEIREAFRSVSQKLEEADAAADAVKQNAERLNLDSAFYSKALGGLRTAAEKTEAALSAVETNPKNAGQLASAVSEFEQAYLALPDFLTDVSEVIRSCPKQLSALFSNS